MITRQRTGQRDWQNRDKWRRGNILSVDVLFRDSYKSILPVCYCRSTLRESDNSSRLQHSVDFLYVGCVVVTCAYAYAVVLLHA